MATDTLKHYTILYGEYYTEKGLEKLLNRIKKDEKIKLKKNDPWASAFLIMDKASIEKYKKNILLCKKWEGKKVTVLDFEQLYSDFGLLIFNGEYVAVLSDFDFEEELLANEYEEH